MDRHLWGTGDGTPDPTKNVVEWDVDTNVPMYTRDYLRLERERKNRELQEIQRWIDESEGN